MKEKITPKEHLEHLDVMVIPLVRALVRSGAVQHGQHHDIVRVSAAQQACRVGVSAVRAAVQVPQPREYPHHLFLPVAREVRQTGKCSGF